LCLNANC